VRLRFPGKEKGGLRAAFLFFLFALTVFASGKFFQVVLGALRAAVFLAAAAWLWRWGRTCRSAPAYALAVAGFGLLSLGHAFSSVYFWVSLQHALNILLAGVLLGFSVLLLQGEEGYPARGMFLPVLSAVAAAQVVLALAQFAGEGTTRPHGTFSNPMFLSEFLAVAALFFASRSFLEAKAGVRKGIAWGAAAVVLLAAALCLTRSRGVVVALVPALAVLAVAHFGAARGAKAFLLLLPGLAALGWYSVSRFFLPDVYNYGRWVFWRSALRVFASNPFGVGLGGYKYHWFATQEPFPEAFRRFAKYAVTPHNEYLEVLTGLGFAGLLLFLVVLLLPLRFAARGWGAVAQERRWAAAAALSGLVLTGTNALFHFNWHEFGVVFTDVLLLGILWSALPESSLGPRVEIRPSVARAGALLFAALGILSLSLLAGSLALGRGEALAREGRPGPAEKAFLAAARLDPWRATIPDALSALYYRRFVAVEREGASSADGLLLSSIRWQKKAMELCPMEQGFLFRQANLFVEKYRRGGDRRDLETAADLTGEILRINPYVVEGHWNRAEALLLLGREDEAIGTLEQAVSAEPNFCRGYAKLSELTERADSRRARTFETKAAECREAAGKRVLKEGERWMVSEPGALPRGETRDAGGGGP